MKSSFFCLDLDDPAATLAPDFCLGFFCDDCVWRTVYAFFWFEAAVRLSEVMNGWCSWNVEYW